MGVIIKAVILSFYQSQPYSEDIALDSVYERRGAGPSWKMRVFKPSMEMSRQVSRIFEIERDNKTKQWLWKSMSF